MVISTKQSDGTIVTTTFKHPPVLLQSIDDIKFIDITNNWARDYISRLVSRGIVNNVKRYHPDNNLTRAEFLKITFNAASWKAFGTGTIVFEDVMTDTWYAPYVALATSRGIITSKNTYFRPNDTITRAEAAKIIVGVLGVSLANNDTSFADVDPYSDLTPYIETAKNFGFFTGQMIDGELRFRPNDPITRAEIAKVVVNAFNL